MTGKHWKALWKLGAVLFAIGEIGAALHKGKPGEWDTASEYWDRLPPLVQKCGLIFIGAVIAHFIKWHIPDNVPVPDNVIINNSDVTIEANQTSDSK